MAKKARKLWLPTTPKKSKPKVPPDEKEIIWQKCNALIEKEFKPKYIEPPPTSGDFNYRVGQWWEIERGLSLSECLEQMRTNPLLQP
jgi:hypothetical protein